MASFGEISDQYPSPIPWRQKEDEIETMDELFSALTDNESSRGWDPNRPYMNQNMNVSPTSSARNGLINALSKLDKLNDNAPDNQWRGNPTARTIARDIDLYHAKSISQDVSHRQKIFLGLDDIVNAETNGILSRRLCNRKIWVHHRWSKLSDERRKQCLASWARDV